MKKLSTLLKILFAALSLAALTMLAGCSIIPDGEATRGLEYKLVDDGESRPYYVVAGYSGISMYVTIPSAVNGIIVKEIGDLAFYNCDKMKSVTIPDSVESIGAFAFSDCRKLKKITISPYNSTYKDIDGNLYTKDGKTLIKYAMGKIATRFVIPDGVESIGDHAFYLCKSLKSVTIPDSVEIIGDNAFRGCTGLKSVTIGNGVTSIGSSAFERCTGLTSVTIPDGVMSIGASAFSNCINLTSVTLGNSVKSIGEGAFSSCISLTSVTFANTKDWVVLREYSTAKRLPTADLADPATAAKYLESTYNDCLWTR